MTISDDDTLVVSGEGGRIDDEPLIRALGDRYLTYALSTIMHRALPDVRDGLKPVHRRLLWAMRLLKLDPGSGFKKSARVVGDVIGKYHPHGDQAVYDALVRLAQSFAVRYPLIDGQGNFGNVDGDSAAAMRYTESRLTEFAGALMEGLSEDAVDFRDTYDGEDSEPVVLPSAAPNLLANGSQGIAVGMATSIPPHNMGELCAGLRLLLTDPATPDEALFAAIPGPDFPTGGVLVEPADSIRDAYRTGRGGFRLRARWQVEETGRGQYQIVVTEIPYQVGKSKLIEKIAELISTKKTPLLADVRDESAEDVRVVLEPKSRSVDPAALMEGLFKQTELETRFSLNMNVLNAQRTPGVLSLRAVLTAFLDHRREVLLRRSQHRRDKIDKRLEMLEGYIVAYLNLDRVIAIIREEDEPKPVLMAEFALNDTQAEAILNMRLRSLRKLEEMELRRERDALSEERAGIEALLADPALQSARLLEQVNDVDKRFGLDAPGGARRTTLADAPVIDAPPIEAMIEREPVTVILSERGWIRAMKGHIPLDSEIKYKDGDEGRFVLHAETTSKLLLLASGGRVFTIGADKLPGGRSMGEPVRLMIDLPNEEDIIALFPYVEGEKRIIASTDGRGFVVASDDLLAQTRAGKAVLNVDAPARALACVRVTPGDDHVAVVGQNRKLLVFALEEMPEMARGKGVILQRFKDGGLSDLRTLRLAGGLSWLERGGRTRSEPDLTEWRGKRAGAGYMAPRGFPRDNRFG